MNAPKPVERPLASPASSESPLKSRASVGQALRPDSEEPSRKAESGHLSFRQVSWLTGLGVSPAPSRRSLDSGLRPRNPAYSGATAADSHRLPYSPWDGHLNERCVNVFGQAELLVHAQGLSSGFPPRPLSPSLIGPAPHARLCHDGFQRWLVDSTRYGPGAVQFLCLRTI